MSTADVAVVVDASADSTALISEGSRVGVYSSPDLNELVVIAKVSDLALRRLHGNPIGENDIIVSVLEAIVADTAPHFGVDCNGVPLGYPGTFLSVDKCCIGAVNGQ